MGLIAECIIMPYTLSTFFLLIAEDFAMDENDIISTIPKEICELKKRLKKFIVDCPTKGGTGVGNFTEGGIDALLELEGNCFTMCRKGN
jgi:hypothetical protein